MITRIPTLVLLLTCLLLAGAALSQIENDAVWIDVRTHAEYQAGHLAGAKLIPFDGIEAGVAELQLAPDTPIYLYCAVGGRSEIARQRLQQAGYTQVVNVGGLEDARRLAGERED